MSLRSNSLRLRPLLLSLLLASCVQSRWDTPPQSRVEPPPSPSQPAQRSAKGNPPFYEVFGKRYYVMDASTGYSERGVASWYGKKFHGRLTSNGEVYNMHAMTAAHKSLPLPTTVRVTNLQNGRSVIVRVNDRGPFVGNRIIDMSYSAATQLDMVRAGTAMVEVTALDTTEKVLTQVAEPAATAPEATLKRPGKTTVYLQVGAFGDRLNAQQLQTRLVEGGFENVLIHYQPAESPPLHRVRLGPIANVAAYDRLLQRVATLQIGEAHLVTEQGETALVMPEPSGI